MSKIAIIGMECLLPGYITRNNLWDKLIAGESFTSTEEFGDKTIEYGHLKKSESDVFFKKHFSEEKFNYLNTKGELYKWCSYVVEGALKESGYLNNKKVLEKTGIFMGTLGMYIPESNSIYDDLISEKMNYGINLFLKENDFSFHNKDVDRNIKADNCYIDTDNLNNIRNLYGINGPYMSVSAACSTPLYTIKLACLYLENHKADMMIAGSNCANELVSQGCSVFGSLGLIEEEGVCRPLNKNSKGLVGGSGAGALVLKRLEDAVRDGDEILAVIDSIGWSNDGGAKSLLAPCSEGQIASFEDAYSKGVSKDIDYIECHATGTAAGDMEEYKSISNYFYDNGFKPYIGTLKGNTGHFLTASAMGSIVKIILSMQHGVIPKTIRVDDPIGPEVVTENIKWPIKKREKRAAVNAFGFGGINAHMVLKEYIENNDKKSLEEESKEEDIVVVGMDLQVGKVTNKETFYDYVLNKKTAVCDEANIRFQADFENKKLLEALGLESFPKGAYINEVPFDFFKFKFPAKSDMYAARRDVLLLNVANRALIDAGITVDTMNDTAVIVNAGQDFSLIDCNCEGIENKILDSFNKSCPGFSQENIEKILDVFKTSFEIKGSIDSLVGIIPSIRGSRISSHWHFKGPSFILTEQEEALKHSLEIAKILLSRKIVKCVVIGTVEVLGEIGFLFGQKINGTLDEVKKYGIGEGSGVVVLKTKEQALKDKDRIYADLKDLDLNKNDENLRKTIGYSCSLEKYVQLIVNSLEKYYGVKVNKDDLLKNMEKNDLALKNENKKSYIKNIETILQPISENEKIKKYIHKFEYKKENLVFEDYNHILKDNCDNFIKSLEEDNKRTYDYLRKKFKNKKKECIWDRDEIIEMTNGSMSKILGDRYKLLDSFEVRSRMPSPPFLFVSRVTKFDCEYGNLRPSMVETEYDIEEDCIFLKNDMTISSLVLTEASHIGIFLGSYIGVDVTEKEALRFRIVDCTTKVVENVPVFLGDTIRILYKVNKFVKRGDTVIEFFSYECYKGDKLIVVSEAIGGFFTEEDLKSAKGIIAPKFKLDEKKSKTSLPVKVLRNKKYSEQDVRDYFEGRLSKCFDDVSLEKMHKSYYLHSEVRMLDKVTEIKNSGGKYGLGYIKGSKRIDPSFWVFKAHFKNDPVLPGTLILEGASQLFFFFVLHYGFINAETYKNIGVIENLVSSTAFRGQVRPKVGEIEYVIDIKKLTDKGLIAEANVYWDGVNVIRQDNISTKF